MPNKAEDVDPKKCLAVGEGVDQSVVGRRTRFAVTNAFGLCNLVAVNIEGPGNPAADLEPDDKGNVIVSYVPTAVAEYTIHVKVKDKPLRMSPFKCDIIDAQDPKLKKVAKVEVGGKGIIIGKATQKNEFYVDSRAALIDAGLQITIKPPERASAQLDIQDNHNGVHKVVYKPTTTGLYVINVKVDGVHVPNSPFYVRVTQ